MKTLLLAILFGLFVSEIVCPPVNPKPVEGDSPEEDPHSRKGKGSNEDAHSREDNYREEQLEHENWDDLAFDIEEGFGLEYDRYLREVVMALEEDEAFRKKLEETNMTDIKSGKIAMHLDLVSHQVRERLDEIKRQEMVRLRNLYREKMKAMNGIQRMDASYPHHVDVKNPHSFEARDLEKLIQKATNDLDEIDKKRRGEFKEYEMAKEHERQEELKKLNEEERKKAEQQYEELEKKHKDHPKVHHPGSKDQLETVWEETDKMDPDDFNPKTFFKLHDMDGDGKLDQEEVEALFQKELDQVYDPNLPEDDMRERYEEMNRMREHVFGELDGNKDHFIDMDEFLNYTNTQEFEKDEGWKTVDDEEIYTDEEYQKYEEMLREHEQRMREQGLDPNMIQPGMVPVPHDPNVQQMQMPQGQGHPPGYQPGMEHQQQQHFEQQQLQQQHQQQQQQQFQQQQQQHFEQQQQFQQQQGHPPGYQPGMPGQVNLQIPGGQMPVQGGQMPPQMPGGQMPSGQGQRPGDQPIAGGPPGGVQQGQPQAIRHGQPVQGQPIQGQPMQGQGQPMQGQQMQGQPMQGQQMQGQGQPMQGQPMQGQGQPMQGQGQPIQGQPQGVHQGQEPLKYEGHQDVKKPMV